MKKIFVLIMVGGILAGFTLRYLLAEEKPDQKKDTPIQAPPKVASVYGKVRAVNPDNSMIFIVTGKGEDVFFVIDDKTKITKTRNIRFEDVKPDDSISVRYETESGANMAQSINVAENNPVASSLKK